MIRLFIAPRGAKEQIIVTLEQLRADAQDMLRFGGAVKQQCLEGRTVLQNQVYIRALAVDFFVSLLRTIDSWAEGTLAEIKERGTSLLTGRTTKGFSGAPFRPGLQNDV